MSRRIPAAVVVLAALTAGAAPPPAAENPWPAIRKERIRRVLPLAMERARIDAWLVLCRENDNDPLAAHVGCENAGGTAAFLFTRTGGGAGAGAAVRSIALSPAGEATALRDLAIHDEVVAFDRGGDVLALVAERLQAAAPARIAVNSSDLAAADGLSYTQRIALEKALGPVLASRLVSSEELVVEWLSVKLPAEIAILRSAAATTARLEEEAYRTVVPRKTRDSDLARFLKRRMAELGVTDAWAPDQNPNVNSGADRGHSHATDKVIEHGDVIQTDFGIKVHGVWVSDIQRFAYVLRPGESRPPAAVQRAWDNARKGNRIALAALVPGARGYDVDKAQRDWMQAAGSLPVPWGTGHPVGYWAHDLGPALSGAQTARPPSGNALRPIRAGQVFAFDGFFAWPHSGTATKTISVEEMAVVTETGAEYLTPPQEDLILVR